RRAARPIAHQLNSLRAFRSGGDALDTLVGGINATPSLQAQGPSDSLQFQPHFRNSGRRLDGMLRRLAGRPLLPRLVVARTMTALISSPIDEQREIFDAERRYVELFGSALVLNTYLKIGLLCLAVVAVGLLALNFRTIKKYESLKPLVIRIDD